MASINSLKASDGGGNASVATVQNIRSAGATTIVVDTVQNINTNFFGSMGTPHTFTDPVTSETITVISEATAVDFKGHVDGSNLEIDTIAPGYTDAGSAVGDIVIIKPTTQWADEAATILAVTHNDDGTLKSNIVTTAKIADSNVTTAKVADSAITPAKLLAGAGTSWPWQSWSPTWTNLTVGNGTVVANYVQIGKTVHFRLRITWGSTTSASGNVGFSPPTTPIAELAASQGYFIGVGKVLDVGVAEYMVWPIVTSTSLISLYTMNVAGTYGTGLALSNTVPITWATGDVLEVTGTYETA